MKPGVVRPLPFWQRPLFGTKNAVRTPAGSVAVRCARIRVAGDLGSSAWMIGGLFAGLGVFFGLIMGAMVLAAMRFPATTGAGPAWVGVLPKRVDLVPALVTIASLVTFVVAVPRFARWIFDRSARGFTLEQLHCKRRHRRHGWRVLAIVGAGIAMLCTLGVLLRPSWGWALPIAKLLCMVGGMTVGIGLFSRRGSKVVCAKCDYPMNTWRGSADRCPECGHGWKAAWGAAIGVRGVQWRIVVVGAGMLVAATGLMAGFGMWALR